MKGKSKNLGLLLVSLLISIGLFFAVNYDVESLLPSLKPESEYCQKVKYCVIPELDTEKCAERIRVMLKSKVAKEKEFGECNECISKTSCALLMRGECGEICNIEF